MSDEFLYAGMFCGEHRRHVEEFEDHELEEELELLQTLEPDAFLERLYHINDMSEAEGISVPGVFHYMNTLYNKREFSKIDNMLSKIDLQLISFSLIRTFLVTSYWAKEHLVNRQDFYDKCLKYLLVKVGERAHDIVRGTE